MIKREHTFCGCVWWIIRQSQCPDGRVFANTGLDMDRPLPFSFPLSNFSSWVGTGICLVNWPGRSRAAPAQTNILAKIIINTSCASFLLEQKGRNNKTVAFKDSSNNNRFSGFNMSEKIFSKAALSLWWAIIKGFWRIPVGLSIDLDSVQHA